MGFFGPQKYLKQQGLKKEIRKKSPPTRTLSPREKKFVEEKIGKIKELVSEPELKRTIGKLYRSGKISEVDKQNLKKLFGIKKLY